MNSSGVINWVIAGIWFDITFDIDNIYFEFKYPIKKLEKFLQIGASPVLSSFFIIQNLNLSFEVADDNIDLLPKALGPTSDLLLCNTQIFHL